MRSKTDRFFVNIHTSDHFDWNALLEWILNLFFEANDVMNRSKSDEFISGILDRRIENFRIRARVSIYFTNYRNFRVVFSLILHRRCLNCSLTRDLKRFSLKISLNIGFFLFVNEVDEYLHTYRRLHMWLLSRIFFLLPNKSEILISHS